MMQLHLLRTEQTEDGIFGTLKVGAYIVHTCEDDWRDNQPSVSCIPAGSYRLHRTIYQKHGYETFEVTGVPGRSRILIHPGNTEEDTQGCILVGLRRGLLRVPDEDDPAHPMVMKRAVVASQDAFRRFMSEMAHVDEAELTVEWAVGLLPTIPTT